MEANRAASHVECFAKVVKRTWKLETGRYRVKPIREYLQSHSLIAYYFGHLQKCNFFFSERIVRLHFPLALRCARSCKPSTTTRNISSQGAGLPVQISNCRAA